MRKKKEKWVCEREFLTDVLGFLVIMPIIIIETCLSTIHWAYQYTMLANELQHIKASISNFF